MTSVVISQPMFFPWPGFFEQMMLADVYLWLDDAQFSKGSFTNRIQLMHGGAVKWMSIPLAGKGSSQRIRDLAPARDFRAAHLDFLKQSLSGAPFATDALDIAAETFKAESLCDLLIASTEIPARWMGLATPKHCSCTSQINVFGSSWQRVLDLVIAVGGSRYITGHGAASYLDHQAFERSGVDVEYMAYSRTPWRVGPDFTPYVSILDLIARQGRDAAHFLKPASINWREFLDRKDVA